MLFKRGDGASRSAHLHCPVPLRHRTLSTSWLKNMNLPPWSQNPFLPHPHQVATESAESDAETTLATKRCRQKVRQLLRQKKYSPHGNTTAPHIERQQFMRGVHRASCKRSSFLTLPHLPVPLAVRTPRFLQHEASFTPVFA